MDFEILDINAREVLDSRGNPTVEVDLKTKSGISRAIVPSGASTGVHEALELRDGDGRYLGKGVRKAIKNIDKDISKEILGLDCRNQREIDSMMIELDGTENKSRLGANAILAVSMAVAKASALELRIPLYKRIADLSGNRRLLMPTPSMNVINGGFHAGNELDIQEYMILPTGAENLREGVRICVEVYQTLKGILRDRYGKSAINVGDEGGFAPPLKKVEEPLDLILNAIDKLDYGDYIEIAIDAAASGFYIDNKYLIEGKYLSGDELGDRYEDLIELYPIVSLEDPFSEDDWNSWSQFNKKYGSNVQVVGDDILVTNVKRIKNAIKLNACNALLLKVNQIGTITESIEAAKLSRDNEWNVMVSHRSGETEDSFIADLAVGLGTGQIKSGAPCRSERNAKYNQLMRIEEELEHKGVGYQGKI